MTVPVSLPLAAPTLPDAPTAGTTDPTADAFAAVLAALSGTLGVPVAQMTVQVADAPAGTDGAAGGAVEAACTAPTGTWEAVTQRQALPGIVPAGTDTTPLQGEAPPTGATARSARAIAPEAGAVGPRHATPGTAVRATTPAAEHAPLTRLEPLAGAEEAPPAAALDAEAAAVPALPTSPDVAPAPQVATAPEAPSVPDVAAAPQVAPAAPAPAAAQAPVERSHEVGPARHVQPAVLEAARGLRHEGGGRTSLVVRLDPPELGAVLVRLTVQDGRVDVTLRTPDLVARTDLQAQQYDVQQVLRDQGFDLSSFDVAHGDVFTDVFPGNQGDSPDRGTPQRSRRADGRLDDHHPVMDDGPAPPPSGTWL